MKWHVFMAHGVLCWWCFFLPISFLFCHLIYEVTCPIITRLCHMFKLRWWPRFTLSAIWGSFFPRKNLVAHKYQNFGMILGNYMTWSWSAQERNEISSVRKRLAKYDHSHACVLNLVNFSLQVEKIGPYFWSTQKHDFHKLISWALLGDVPSKFQKW